MGLWHAFGDLKTLLTASVFEIRELQSASRRMYLKFLAIFEQFSPPKAPAPLSISG